MKNITKIIFIAALIVGCITIFYACKEDFLAAQPYGQYGSEQIKNKKGLDALLVGAYGVLDG